MAAPAQGEDSDDGMDEFMEKFKAQKYKNAFNESNWEEVRKNCHVISKKTHWQQRVTSGGREQFTENQAVCCNIAFG